MKIVLQTAGSAEPIIPGPGRLHPLARSGKVITVRSGRSIREIDQGVVGCSVNPAESRTTLWYKAPGLPLRRRQARQGRSRPGAWAWGICWLMFASTVLNYMDRQTIALVGPQIKAEFGLDNVGFGWVLAAFQLTYAFFQLPAGYLVDRWNVRRAYAGAVAVVVAGGDRGGVLAEPGRPDGLPGPARAWASRSTGPAPAGDGADPAARRTAAWATGSSTRARPSARCSRR